jgi:membrane protein
MALEVLVTFRRTHGLLMAGAIAYYTLLSLVPLFALLLIGSPTWSTRGD